VEDLIGKRFSSLVVLKIMKGNVGGKDCLVKCDCGKEKWLRSYNLKRGFSKSCGCGQRSGLRLPLVYKPGIEIRGAILQSTKKVKGEKYVYTYLVLKCKRCGGIFEKTSHYNKTLTTNPFLCPHCQMGVKGGRGYARVLKKPIQTSFLDRRLGYTQEEIDKIHKKINPEAAPVEIEVAAVQEVVIEPLVQEVKKPIFETLDQVRFFIKKSEEFLAGKCPLDYSKDLSEGVLSWDKKAKRIVFEFEEIGKPIGDWDIQNRFKLFKELPEFIEECIQSQVTPEINETIDKLTILFYPAKDPKKVSTSKFLGKTLKLERIEKNLTQEELAEKCDCLQKAISRYESGGVLPRQEALERIAKALDKPISYFLDQ